MMVFKKILCPVDFSKSSYHALDEAIWWLTSYEAENNHTGQSTLCLMHVLPTAYSAAGDIILRQSDFDEREQAIKELYRVVKSRVPKDMQPCVLRVVQRGEPAHEITSLAKSEGYQLIVMGTHGLTGWRHIVLGSVTEAVVRTSPCPILTVRHDPHRPDKEHPDIRNVMCPTDFSQSSLTAFPWAVELATHFRAQLQIIHVLEPLSPVLGVVSIEDFDSARTGEAAQAMLQTIEQHVSPDLQENARQNRVVRIGAAAEQIVNAAKEENTDLIVIVTHGQTGWRHLVFGSVAEEVVRYAPCPVMAIREPRTLSPDASVLHETSN